MLIEFAGCSGAGKSSTIAALMSRPDVSDLNFVTSRAVLGSLTRTAWIRSTRVQNLAWDGLLFPDFVRAILGEGPGPGFVLSSVRERSSNLMDAAIRLRAAIRQIGGHQCITRRAPVGSTILVDEGIIATTQSLMVHLRDPTPVADLLAFARLLPAPDLILHVDTPVEECLRRAFARPDKPLRGSLVQDLESFVRNAHRSYRILSESPELQERWIRIEPDATDLESPSQLAGTVLAALSPHLPRRGAESGHA